MGQFKQYRTMETATLQICKRIYNEGTPDVYSKNVFNISKAKQLHRFINQVGAVNLKLALSTSSWSGTWIFGSAIVPTLMAGFPCSNSSPTKQLPFAISKLDSVPTPSGSWTWSQQSISKCFPRLEPNLYKSTTPPYPSFGTQWYALSFTAVEEEVLFFLRHYTLRE